MAFSAIRVVIPGKAAVSLAGPGISVPAHRAPAPGDLVRVLSPLLDSVRRVTRARTVPVITHIEPRAISPTHHTHLRLGASIAASRRVMLQFACILQHEVRPAAVIPGPSQFTYDLHKTA